MKHALHVNTVPDFYSKIRSTNDNILLIYL